MPNIALPQDFTVGEIKIPNAISQNTGEGINGDLQYIIDKYEAKLLKALLGQSQYDLLQTELADLDSAPQYWKDLVSKLTPAIQNYIYCKWLDFDEVKLTTVGGGKGKASGFTMADTTGKYVDRWNELVDYVEDIREYLDASADLELIEDYPKVGYCSALFGKSDYDTI